MMKLFVASALASVVVSASEYKDEDVYTATGTSGSPFDDDKKACVACWKKVSSLSAASSWCANAPNDKQTTGMDGDCRCWSVNKNYDDWMDRSIVVRNEAGTDVTKMNPVKPKAGVIAGKGKDRAGYNAKTIEGGSAKSQYTWTATDPSTYGAGVDADVEAGMYRECSFKDLVAGVPEEKLTVNGWWPQLGNSFELESADGTVIGDKTVKDWGLEVSDKPELAKDRLYVAA